ncbi:MAG: efflux RND transporter periplasmic adaptor subunit [Pseudomonadota bacterium]
MNEDTRPFPGPQAGSKGDGPRGSVFGAIQVLLVIGVLGLAIVLNRVLVTTNQTTPTVAVPALDPLVEIIRPVATTETFIVSETGTVEARAEVEISPLVGGRVVWIAPGFASGASFERGERLFQIDQEDFELRAAQAQAELRSAQSSLALTEAESASAIREWRLVNGDEPVPPLVARAPQIAQAKAAVEVAKSALADAKLALSRTNFSMPFSGRVLTTNLEVGTAVSANQSYGTAYRTAHLEVVTALDPPDLAQISPVEGRTARITATSRSSGEMLTGKVVRVESALNARTRLVGVTISLETPEALLPGTFVDVMIEGPPLEQVYVLPPEAINASGGVWLVSEGQLTRRSVKVLSRDETAVLAPAFGYADGVVTTPPAGAREGQAVRVATTLSSTGLAGGAGHD